MSGSSIFSKLREVFDEKTTIKLVEVIEERWAIYDKMVTKEEFNKLKEVVKELADTQKKTEEHLTKLEEKMAELAEAQRKTEERVNELVEAQKKTEQRLTVLEEKMAELAEAQRKTEEELRALTGEMRDMRKEFGGFQRTISYAFENEAYQKLPKFLKGKFGIEVLDKMVRMDIEGFEINFFANAKKNGKRFCIVGEVQMKLDEKEELLKKKRKQKNIFEELEEKAEIVKEEYKKDVIKLLVCHFATKGFLKIAKEKNIIVIQSFELE